MELVLLTTLTHCLLCLVVCTAGVVCLFRSLG